MKLFQVDLRKLTFLLLPTFLRQKKLVMLVISAAQSLIALYVKFTNNREANLYKLAHTGQTCYLRKVLNDAFPDRNKSFQIDDIENKGEWLYAMDEDLPAQLYFPALPDYIMVWSADGIATGASNFLVIIPDNLQGTDNLNRIKSIVNEYKLMSKKPFYTYG